MMIDLIAVRNVYTYSRKTRKEIQQGRVLVGELVKKPNGWYVIGHDYRNNRALELRPAQVLAPVRKPANRDLEAALPRRNKP